MTVAHRSHTNSSVTGLRPRAERRGPPPVLAILASAFIISGCDGEDTALPEAGTIEANNPGIPTWFQESGRERGLVFEHDSGHDGRRHLFPEIMGGGAALCDLDGDADLDAYLVQSGSLHPGAPAAGNRFFRNDGKGYFEDESEASGAADPGYGMGVAIGDVENDGDLDLYVTNVGTNALLVNDGSAHFSNRTGEAAVQDPSWSVSAAFFDAERDGDLDLFVTNYIFWSLADELSCRGQADQNPDYCSPKSYAAPAPDVLFFNDGEGRFRDVSADAGLRTAFGNGLGVVCGDFDLDGWEDVFVANDGTLNQLWRNKGDGTFEDAALRTGVAVDEHGIAKAGMGVAAADLDDDGDEDLLIVNLASESDSFYRNDGEYFSDRTAVAGLAIVSRRYTRFGTGFADFDQDGRPDLYQANGRVARGTENAGPYSEPNLVLRGLAGCRFEGIQPPDGLSTPLIETSRGAAFGDVDGDGAIDVLVVNRDGPAHLLLNTVPNRGGWVSLSIRETAGRDALGARVQAQLGERTLTRTVRSAYSYASASSPALHFGLGPEEGLREVSVTWPDGVVERFGDVAGGRRHVLERGSGTE